jgi:hypothetical protein
LNRSTNVVFLVVFELELKVLDPKLDALPELLDDRETDDVLDDLTELDPKLEDLPPDDENAADTSVATNIVNNTIANLSITTSLLNISELY